MMAESALKLVGDVLHATYTPNLSILCDIDELILRNRDIFFPRNVYSGNKSGPTFAGEQPVRYEEMPFADYVWKISVDTRHGMILEELIVRLSIKHILEIGTGFGVSTSYLLSGLQRNSERHTPHLVTFELRSKLFQYIWFLLKRYPKEYWQAIHSDAEIILPLINMEFQMAFIDAGHEYDQSISLWNALKYKITSGGCVVFDDIYWSEDMKRVWQYISQDPIIHGTHQTNRFGIGIIR